MRVLITYGTKRGGTEGIARILGEALEGNGFTVEVTPASRVRDTSRFDAAIVGGALYANRWHRDARRFISRHESALRQIPSWCFSSGPLDDSADRAEIPPTAEVRVLMERIGALAHTTFGGRLSSDARGFPASAMAKTRSGDFRNPERIRAWAAELARALPQAHPGTAVKHPARSVWRLIAYGFAGWALCAATMAGLMQLGSLTFALVFHAILAPCIFAALSQRYFRARGARAPLFTAAVFTLLVVALDLAVVGGLVMHDTRMFASVAGTWLPLALIFLATWITGSIVAMMPADKASRRVRSAREYTKEPT